MSQDLVPQSEAKQLPASAMTIPAEWGVGRNYGQFVTSCKEDTPEGKKMLLRHLNEDGDQAAKWLNKQFGLVHVTIHPISFAAQDTGEIVNTTRVLLHTDSGSYIDFRSDGILKSLYLIFRFSGPPPYNPPLLCELRSRGLDGGKSMYALSVVEDGVPSKHRK